MMATAIDEYLDENMPRKPTKQSTWDLPGKHSWNPDKIKWKDETGAKGPYEKADSQATPDFKAMLQDLKAHDGKMNREQFFYWTFSDLATVGRKKRAS